MKNSNTYSALLNKEGIYSTFEIPSIIQTTRRLKKIAATIQFWLRFSETSTSAGIVSFASIEDAKAVITFNSNRKDVTGMKLSIRNN